MYTEAKGSESMERLQRLDRSRTAFWMVLLLAGVGILGLNWMTPLLADDYTYVHSWADWSIIKSPLQIPASMYQHGLKMNGRMVSHAFEQFFLIFPKHVFDFFNAAMLVWVLTQSHRICTGKGRRSLLLFVLCGMGFWHFTPFFGQVCLWQDGSVNYLWSLGFGLFCLRPYLDDFLNPEDPGWDKWWKRLLFLPAALLYGMYVEASSFAVIMMALGLLIARRIHTKSGKTWLWLPLALMIAGYGIMITMPAELQEKAGDFQLLEVLRRLVDTLTVLLERFLALLLSWTALMTAACLRRTDGKRRLVSLAFLLGAFAGAGVLAAAATLPMRALCVCALFLIIANGILIAELLPQPEKILCFGLSAALCVCFALSFKAGLADNLRSHRQWLNFKAAIDHAIEAGERTAVVENLRPETEYSAAYGLTGLSSTDPDVWPNGSIASWFGLDGILAK